MCKQLREAYRKENYCPECIKLPEDKKKKAQIRQTSKPSVNKILVKGVNRKIGTGSRIAKKVVKKARASPPKQTRNSPSPQKKTKKGKLKETAITEAQMTTSNESDEEVVLTQPPEMALKIDDAQTN